MIPTSPATQLPAAHGLRRSTIGAAALGVLALLVLPAVVGAVPDVPADFQIENAAGTSTFSGPTSIAFLPGGRMLVTEKRGRVWSVTNGVKSAAPMIALDNEVLNQQDRGLLAIAVDPNYVTNHYVYLLYTVEPDSSGSDGNIDAFGRLTRYTVSFTDSNVFLPSSRTILMGYNWRNGPCSGSPSHTIGDLHFARDGSLIVTTGDGAQFTSTPDAGGVDAGMFGATKTDPYEDIGAFRSQYIGSLAGKILRINPATGHGYASNPFYDGNLTSVKSRVWGYGLRNPYHFTIRPGTGSTNPADGNPGTIYIGDVGWSTYEDLNIATGPGRNFGWPCYEGPGQNSPYQNANPAHHGCGTIGTPDNPSTNTGPVATWHHSNANNSSPPGFTGAASIGGAFYTGNQYPQEYRGQYFFADYPGSWIRVAQVNASNQLLGILNFGTQMDSPVDITADPVSGDLFYVSWSTGQVRRIRYTGQVPNSPPTAVASADPSNGLPPLVVNCSSAGSSDVDNDPLTFQWDFGDGQTAGGASAQHTYNTSGTYAVVLTANDGKGGIGRDTAYVVVLGTGGGFPSTPVVDNFNRPNGAVGGAWVDPTGLQISNNALVHTSGYSSTVWDGGLFGPNQEAYYTLSAIDYEATEHSLLLKVQGQYFWDGHIEVRWYAPFGYVQVASHEPGEGWTLRGPQLPVTFSPGDQFGARAYPDGTVEIYKNGVVAGATTVGDWAFKALGGRIGLNLDEAYASRVDNFGGGTFTPGANTRPTAEITEPLDGSFFIADESVALEGTGTDAQQASGTLDYRWELVIHHSEHVHPPAASLPGASTSFIPEDHDDGQGYHYEVYLIVTDSGGLSDTAEVHIYPEVDLTLRPLTTVPTTPGTTAPAEYRFAIRNFGGMAASHARWQIVSGATVLASGDTMVARQDSAQVSVMVPPTLGSGSYTVRVVLDSLAEVHELDEGNNALARPLTVVPGPGPDEIPPWFTLGPEWSALETTANFTFETSEPAVGRTFFGPTRSLGTTLGPGPLGTQHAFPVSGLTPGTKYYFSTRATDGGGNSVNSPLDSLVTLNGNVGVEPPPTGLALSMARPNPTRGAASMALELPAAARVHFRVHDVQGRELWRGDRELQAGRWQLEWPGTDDRGQRASAGIYLIRVATADKVWFRRVALIR